MFSPDADADATIPATLEDMPQQQQQQQPAVLVQPMVEEPEEKLAARDQLLRNCIQNPPPRMPVENPKADWKLLSETRRLDYAEKLAEELNESQINTLMQKFGGVATGEIGRIDPVKLPEVERMNFFTMLEDFVISNRKKVPDPNAPPIKLKPLQPEPKAAVQPAQVPLQLADSGQGAATKVPEQPAQPVKTPAVGKPMEPAQTVQQPSKTQLVDASTAVAEPLQQQPSQTQADVSTVPEPLQPGSNQDPVESVQPKPTVAQVPAAAAESVKVAVKPSSPLAGLTQHVAPAAAPAAEAAETSKMAPESQAAKAGPPNRDLELAGLQALMTAQKQREAEALQQAHQVPRIALTAQTEKIDWSTHKKEGMRLKRLCEESTEGERYPHMKKLFNEGSKEDWVRAGRMFSTIYEYTYIYIYTDTYLQI